MNWDFDLYFFIFVTRKASPSKTTIRRVLRDVQALRGSSACNGRSGWLNLCVKSQGTFFVHGGLSL
jgi:hypothetical protein